MTKPQATTAQVLRNSPTQWFGDRGICQNCGLIAHDDRTLGLVHTGTTSPDCFPQPGDVVVVCHVPGWDYDAGLYHAATVVGIQSNGIVLSDGSRVGNRSLFSSVAALADHVRSMEAMQDADDRMMANAR